MRPSGSEGGVWVQSPHPDPIGKRGAPSSVLIRDIPEVTDSGQAIGSILCVHQRNLRGRFLMFFCE